MRRGFAIPALLCGTTLATQLGDCGVRNQDYLRLWRPAA